jgi:hypothetical protein
MHKPQSSPTRAPEFQKRDEVENLLTEINNTLSVSEELLIQDAPPEFPIIFLVGAARSGSTLLTQWLANTGLFAYPTNLMSRFYKAPILASKIQLLLTDERYNFRNEIRDFNSPIDYSSDNGKTKGALAPNEYWYFWRRFLPFTEVDYLPDNVIDERVDGKTLKAELAGVMNVFQKPFAMKAMILNYNIPFLNRLFEKAIFIYTKRDPLTNIESLLKARERQLGSIEHWYSFKIPEMTDLLGMTPSEQVAGQIFYTNKAIELGMNEIPEHKKLCIQYEKFCASPQLFFEELKSRLISNGYHTDKPYRLQMSFNATRNSITDPAIVAAHQKFFLSL